MARLAILAGSGGLPPRLAAVDPEALRIGFEGVPQDLPEPVQSFRYEHMGTLFDALKTQGVTDVVMAGAMSRPPLDPTAFDPVMMQQLAPRLVAAMQGGDDALLRLVIAIFEEQGFTVRGAHEVDPSLSPTPGVLAGSPLSEAQEADLVRARAIHTALAPQDVAQGCVVENGLCLGIETIQGTDALLRFVSETSPHLRKGQGLLFKAPKDGQDLRIDMPAIGPVTVETAARAGLSAIVIAAGQTLVLDREALTACAMELGLSVVAVEV